jgi:transposase-like protein
MDKKKKQKIIPKSARYYTPAEREEIIKEYLSGGYSKQEIWLKYTGHADERGHLLNWMRELGYATHASKKKLTIVSKSKSMTKKKKTANTATNQDDSFENLQLKKRITELEKQLKDAEMKAIAFSTMVDIAEREFKIPIRKKLNTKP